jgi:cation:H+ antiporter
MLIATLAVVSGFILLVWGADRLVVGAAATARNLGISPLIIGLTIVGIGTSAPEMVVSAVAAWQGNPSIGTGNALGSNITNVALVLGITALVAPIRVESRILAREFPLLLVIMAFALWLASDSDLARVDGLLLIGGMGLLIAWLIWQGLQPSLPAAEPLAEEYAAEIPQDLSTPRALFWLLSGMTILLASARLLVWGAVDLATLLGISDLVIGLTVIALGTSLPELAASVTAALRREHEIAIGNVIGSNMFNLLGVLGLPAAIAPHPIAGEMLWRDFPMMIALTLALWLMARGLRHRSQLTRSKGLLLLAGYLGYLAWLCATARPAPLPPL